MKSSDNGPGSKQAAAKSKRIVIDARMLSYSGIGRYGKNLLEHLQKIDSHNSYLVLVNEQGYKTWHPTGDNFKKVLSPFRPYSLAEQTGLAKQLYGLKPDLVHFFSFNVPVLFRGRFVVTVHDLTMQQFQNLHGSQLKQLTTKLKFIPGKLVMKSTLERARFVITPSLYVKKQLIKRYGLRPAKVQVTYEAAEALTARPQAVGQLGSKDFLLYVGNAYPHKNLERLVAAWEQLLVRHPKLWLVMAGRRDSFYNQLEEQAKARHTPRLLFINNPSDRQLVWLYQNAKLFVFPSLSEGFGLTGLEAMTYGTPVLAARATCLPEVYGKAALYFDPTKPLAIANAVSDVVDKPERLTSLAQAGLAQTKRYSWQTTAHQTHALYQKLL